MLRRLNKYFEELEFYRYGIMAMTLTAGSCLGSGAVMFIAMNDGAMWQIAACSVVSMTANTAAISLTSMRLVAWSFIISVVVNSVLIVINI